MRDNGSIATWITSSELCDGEAVCGRIARGLR